MHFNKSGATIIRNNHVLIFYAALMISFLFVHIAYDNNLVIVYLHAPNKDS